MSEGTESGLEVFELEEVWEEASEETDEEDSGSLDATLDVWEAVSDDEDTVSVANAAGAVNKKAARSSRERIHF